MTSRDFISSDLPTATNVEIGIGSVALASIFELSNYTAIICNY